jgi:LPXTG-motif cell wall-anchored protein
MSPALPPRLPGRLGPRLLLVVALVGALLSVVGTAHAATGYRYWNYFHVKNGAYQFATTGPSGYVPKDGSVEAYRYGLSGGTQGLHPRTAASTYTVADICKGKKAGSGQKRVGVLIDYGTKADAASGQTPPAPRAGCAVVAANANGQQVLDQVAQLRVQKQLICGIDGYPVSGCSVTVKDAPAAPADKSVDFTLPAASGSSGSSSTGGSSAPSTGGGGGVAWPLVGVAAAVVVLGGGGLLMARRRRDA